MDDVRAKADSTAAPSKLEAPPNDTTYRVYGPSNNRTLYKYRTETGRTVIVDDFGKIPKRYRSTAVKLRTRSE